MTLTKNVLLACLITVLFTSCTKKTPIQKLVEETFLLLEEKVTILETIKDKESALAAKPKLESVIAKLIKKCNDLNIPPDDIWSEMEYADNERLSEYEKKWWQLFSTLRKDEEIQSILGETFEKLYNW